MYLRLFFVYSGAVSALLVFYSDPNRDPHEEFGAESAGSEKSPPAGAVPAGGVRFSVHFFRYPTLAMKPLIFCAASFFMPAVTCVYTSSENSAEACPRISATVFGSMPLWIASVENVCLRSWNLTCSSIAAFSSSFL